MADLEYFVANKPYSNSNVGLEKRDFNIDRAPISRFFDNDVDNQITVLLWRYLKSIKIQSVMNRKAPFHNKGQSILFLVVETGLKSTKEHFLLGDCIPGI